MTLIVANKENDILAHRASASLATAISVIYGTASHHSQNHSVPATVSETTGLHGLPSQPRFLLLSHIFHSLASPGPVLNLVFHYFPPCDIQFPPAQHSPFLRPCCVASSTSMLRGLHACARPNCAALRSRRELLGRWEVRQDGLLCLPSTHCPRTEHFPEL